MRRLVRSKFFLGSLLILALAGGGAAWQRQPILAWLYIRQLSTADEAKRAVWIERVAGLDEAAVPALVDRLQTPSALVCSNIEAALGTLALAWGPEDPRTFRLAERLAAAFEHLGKPGRRSTLHLLTTLLNLKGPTTLPATLTQPCGAVLVRAEEASDLVGPTLLLATALLERTAAGEWVDRCRALAMKGLASAQPGARLAAVQLVSHDPLQHDAELIADVVALLRDATPAVRRRALVVLAPARDRVSDDDLLPLLHDPDADVQQMCVNVLRSRGLTENHILYAGWITDESPAARLRVVERLGRAADLDPGVWLRRLTEDTAPAVRAAAIRAAGLNRLVDLADRLREMADQDPSETVRQNARYYLARRAQEKE